MTLKEDATPRRFCSGFWFRHPCAQTFWDTRHQLPYNDMIVLQYSWKTLFTEIMMEALRLGCVWSMPPHLSWQS